MAEFPEVTKCVLDFRQTLYNPSLYSVASKVYPFTLWSSRSLIWPEEPQTNRYFHGYAQLPGLTKRLTTHFEFPPWGSTRHEQIGQEFRNRMRCGVKKNRRYIKDEWRRKAICSKFAESLVVRFWFISLPFAGAVPFIDHIYGNVTVVFFR